ncbi:hypothetical protein LPB86_03835 [Pedobacter sp. MC2016-14]|uniref:hypothetical protein n=1 Tax=Pedobacter sp. MC2016-14 TaxID=2897327 RepID=UPI001E5E7105|nr:hypothetical protein [Pedobacter sp. MC2016-14]MCD0487345.1 hypothetical protein [Pedobacter sp. MC2016-14]
MKKQIKCIVFLILSYSYGYSQDKLSKSLKIKQSEFYRSSLQVDSAKADKVGQIQASYKAGMNQAIADTSLNDAAKRARIKALMDAKNQQLRLLLSPAQQAKMIPTTEREQAVPAKTN